MSVDPDSERTVLNRNLHSMSDARLSRLESRLDSIEEMIHKQNKDIGQKIKDNLEQFEIIIADRVINRAVKSAFSHFGINVENPNDLQELRDDLRFNRLVRDIIRKGITAIFATICGGIAVWIVKAVLGIQIG